MNWQPVIGLEIHAQLRTQSKIFSGAPTAFGAEPNTQACAIDLGLPGVLPVLNAEVVRMAILLGIAINATIAPRSVFARKNYFYPDLPKGYQISQYELPIVHDGYLDITLDNETKRIPILRAHLEEDAGKSLHEDFHGLSGIDLNRAGTPLLEIVSAPALFSAQQAVAYMKSMHSLVRYLGICDGNMQEGSFRCDANVSVRPADSTTLGTRAEIKNINSFRFVERAIEHEIERQIELLENGGQVIQETRLYDSERNETRSMRSKEEAHDYRYFPDPDLLPVEINKEWVETLRQSMPELPQAKLQRFQETHGLNLSETAQLLQNLELTEFYEKVLIHTAAAPKTVVHWLLGEVQARLNREEKTIENCAVSALSLAKLLDRIEDKTISGKIAKTVFEAMWTGHGEPDDIIQKQGLVQMQDANEISRIIDDIIESHPQQVMDYRSGKEKLFGFFVGQVMKVTKGKANPEQVNTLLKTKLG